MIAVESFAASLLNLVEVWCLCGYKIVYKAVGLRDVLDFDGSHISTVRSPTELGTGEVERADNSGLQ